MPIFLADSSWPGLATSPDWLLYLVAGVECCSAACDLGAAWSGGYSQKLPLTVADTVLNTADRCTDSPAAASVVASCWGEDNQFERAWGLVVKQFLMPFHLPLWPVAVAAWSSGGVQMVTAGLCLPAGADLLGFETVVVKSALQADADARPGLLAWISSSTVRPSATLSPDKVCCSVTFLKSLLSVPRCENISGQSCLHGSHPLLLVVKQFLMPLHVPQWLMAVAACTSGGVQMVTAGLFLASQKTRELFPAGADLLGFETVAMKSALQADADARSEDENKLKSQAACMDLILYCAALGYAVTR
eukprot:CAMPEP_0204304670 /NCGR_PEP_ID=MMETSP0468-20130131/84533_1 /ASSEMBLY_ACC=CAM_ASM_000383 /TAXON_ID=2969 /ORGANISM="Oxyrrhis marina" /LENGTH=303 /DNA_ID=CAMNT_0051284001 /DNA_START=80 /DNA_END=992 /DNA_ORIENTATION=+